MAILRCKMCGGDLAVIEGTSSCVCEYCGTTQTIPTVNDENIQNLFNRANTLRMKSEFDRAADIYEKILQNSPTEAEAYWGLILCKYGIEYVEDPATFKRIPTCHRTSYDAVAADDDYKNAIKYADATQRGIYESEAGAIDEIQKGILAVAQKEDPYDVFICYKETDDNGERTQDSVIANEIYYQLKHEGYKVFYSAISLEDKIGTEYEPYIFSALNTAKTMLVIGTKPEYFNAVWVKNEWSRYLKLIKNDRSKILIPCYRDMDPYELPDEFAHLQAQDMSKIGFINDLVRGIKKVVPKESIAEKSIPQESQNVVYSSNISALLDRGNMALEDQEWDKANGFFEEVLNQDARCAEAFVGELLAANKSQDIKAYFSGLLKRFEGQAPTEELTACPEDGTHIRMMAEKYCIPGYLEKSTIKDEYVFDRTYRSETAGRKKQKALLMDELQNEKLLTRAKTFANGETKEALENGISHVAEVLDQRISRARSDDERSVTRIRNAYTKHLNYADQKVEILYDQAIEKKDAEYLAAVRLVENANSIDEYLLAKNKMTGFIGYEEADSLVNKCDAEIARIKEEDRLEAERQENDRRREAEKAAKKKKRNIGIVIGAAAACVIIAVVMIMVVIPENNYNNAVSMMENGDYEAAISAFEAMNGYKDSIEKIEECKYDAAVSLKNNEKYDEAIDAFTALNGYKDSDDLIEKCYIGKLGEERYNTIKNIQINDTYIFGEYEQDNDTSNGKEEIEWIVLDKDGLSLMLISKYALDCKQYNISEEGITWETCTLRKWLNGEFMSSAFSPEEEKYIIDSTVTADRNPKYDTSPGNDTTDKVFLLSITEADKYLDSNDIGPCQGTAYCYAQGAHKAHNGNCRWWLRTPGGHPDYAAFVGSDGAVYHRGTLVNFDDYSELIDHDAVRPALRIDFGS